MFALKYDVQAHPMPIYHVALTEDRQSLLCLSGDKRISNLNINTGERLPFSINIGKSGYALLQVKNLLWIGCTDGNIHIIDLDAKREIKNFALHQAPIFSFEYIPDLDWVIAADGKGLISIWKAASLLNLAKLPVGTQKIRCTLYDNESKALLVASYDGKLYFINPENLNQSELDLHNPQQSEIYCLCKPKKEGILVGFKNGHLGLAKANASKLHLPLHNFGIYSLIKLGNEIVSCSRDKSIKVWSDKDLSNLQKIDHKQQGHHRSVNGLLKIDENSFISYGDDGCVKMWHRSTQVR